MTNQDQGSFRLPIEKPSPNLLSIRGREREREMPKVIASRHRANGHFGTVDIRQGVQERKKQKNQRQNEYAKSESQKQISPFHRRTDFSISRLARKTLRFGRALTEWKCGIRLNPPSQPFPADA